MLRVSREILPGFTSLPRTCRCGLWRRIVSSSSKWIWRPVRVLVRYVELFCGGRTSPKEIAAGVRRYPEVVDACTVTGEADALVHIRAADVRHFEDVMERLRAEPFVIRTRSVIVLSRLVDRYPGTDALVPAR